MRYIGILVALAVLAPPLRAQAGGAGGAPQDSLAAQLRALRARLDSLEGVIERMRTRGAQPEVEAEDELAALRAAALAVTGVEEAMSDTVPEQQQSRTRSLQALNPEISVTGDVVGNFTSPGDAPDNVSATPREFEFSFQSALDPYTHTKVFVTREEGFEIAGVPEEEGAAEEGAGFEIEEGYMYWVGLPGGLGVKLGKFRQEIGLYNRWHTHALLEVERPLAAMVFLGEDGLIQTGGALTLPHFSLGPATQTVTFEVTRGNNEALFGGGNQISYLGRLQNFWDLSSSSYIQLGATGVLGENDDEALDTRLLGLDLSFSWRPPGRALYQGLTLKGEWYFAEKELPAAKLTGNGGYFQANYRLTRQWILGARADYVNPYEGGPKLYQLVPSITWWQSEWVRLRLQYNFVKPEGGDGNHTLLLQSVWAIGPHKHETY